MKNEKNKNKMPWEGKFTDSILTLPTRLSLILLGLVLAMAFGDRLATSTTGSQAEFDEKIMLNSPEATFGGGVNVEDTGYKELVIDYVDENDEKVYSSEMTWLQPEDQYLVNIPSVFGCVPTTRPYFLTMGSASQTLTIRYFTVGYLDAHLAQPSLELLQSHYVSCIYDEDGNAITLEEDQDIANGENSQYLPRVDVELPDAVYVDESLTDRYMELDGELYVAHEGEDGTYLVPVDHSNANYL